MDDYTVIFWNTADHRQWTPTEVYRDKNKDSVKDVQDRIATFAGEHPEIIYMVVKRADFVALFTSGYKNQRK